MTKIDIEAIAREAGISVAHRGDIDYDPYKVSELILQRFAALLLEKAAQVCESIEETATNDWDANCDPHDQGRASGAIECHAAIRSMAAGMGE